MTVCGDRMRNFTLLAVLTLTCLASTYAQDNATNPAERTSTPQAEQREACAADGNLEPLADASPSDQPPRNLAKAAEGRKKALAGLAAICGITIAGVAAIAATIVWARRLRRLARDPGPVQTTAGNDFWFLKPPKQTVVQPDLADRRSQSDSSSERDVSE